MNSTKQDCYRLIQQITLLRDPICVVPGCAFLSSAGHHLFPRARLSTAFDPQAVRGLCHQHHQWVHANPKQATLMFIKLIGVLKYGELERKSRTIMPNFDFEETRRVLKSILTELRNRRQTHALPPTMDFIEYRR